MDVYGVGKASAIDGVGAVACGLPLIGGLSVGWALQPRATGGPLRWGGRARASSPIAPGCLQRLRVVCFQARPLTAAVALLLGTIIGMRPSEVVRATRWKPMTEFTVAYPRPTWQGRPPTSPPSPIAAKARARESARRWITARPDPADVAAAAYSARQRSGW